MIDYTKIILTESQITYLPLLQMSSEIKNVRNYHFKIEINPMIVKNYENKEKNHNC